MQNLRSIFPTHLTSKVLLCCNANIRDKNLWNHLQAPVVVLMHSSLPVCLLLHCIRPINRIYLDTDRKVDLNKKNVGGWTPLMYACYIGHDNIVNLLLDAGVNVNVKNHKGQTPLMLASSCGNESVGYFLVQVCEHSVLLF